MDAFEELYHRFKRHIYSFCLKLTGDRFLAEDATHDTFLKMHHSIATLSDVRLFRSWLFTIARNGVFKTLRRHQRNGSLDEESIWTDETPLTIAADGETATIITSCIDSMKPEYKEVLLLREYEQRSYEEIAVITGNTESSVKSRLFKARKALAEKLKPYFKD
ncbi:MAG: RNA polymerase sigma factor [Ignavibacteria bacterium]|nr:RNA polymerase sigma factor [Ignavibacteria bacterium]